MSGRLSAGRYMTTDPLRLARADAQRRSTGAASATARLRPRPRTLGDLPPPLRAELNASIARRSARLARLPKPDFPPELPVNQRREEIGEAIRANQVVIVCGETGSGKTTQLPKLCLELGRGAGLIGHTQPRRIAARATASRIAQELKSELGQHVGYKIRFTDRLVRTASSSS